MTDPTHINLCFTLKQDDLLPTTALSIPIEEIPNFTYFPLKWLRFLGYVLYGAEGRLAETAGGAAVDYLQVDGLKSMYYYVPDTIVEPRFCLIDVDAISCSTQTTSSSSTRESIRNFRDDIVNRDGRCIMTGTPLDAGICHACHIIPYARGSEYIKRITELRTSRSEDVITNINDPRNGVLLFSSLHDAFDQSIAAFLKTPNFALQTADVPTMMPKRLTQQVAPPELPQDQESAVYIMQYFQSPTNSEAIEVSQFFSPQNAYSLPQKNGNIASPSTTLLDIAYGIAALNAWAPEGFKKRCREVMRPYYYPDAPNISEETEVKSPKSGPSNRQKRCERRSERAEMRRGAGADEGYDCFDMMLGLRMHGMREQRKRAEGEKKRVNEAMVNEWRTTVNQEGERRGR